MHRGTLKDHFTCKSEQNNPQSPPGFTEHNLPRRREGTNAAYGTFSLWVPGLQGSFYQTNSPQTEIKF